MATAKIITAMLMATAAIAIRTISFEKPACLCVVNRDDMK